MSSCGVEIILIFNETNVLFLIQDLSGFVCSLIQLYILRRWFPFKLKDFVMVISICACVYVQSEF